MIIVAATVLHLLLKMISFKSVVAFLSRRKTRKSAQKPEALVKHYSQLMSACNHFHSYLYKCLALSVLFWFLLRRHEVDVEMKFGMYKEAGKMHFHAWLEYHGQPLATDEGAKEKYISFPESIV